MLNKSGIKIPLVEYFLITKKGINPHTSKLKRIIGIQPLKKKISQDISLGLLISIVTNERKIAYISSM